MPTETETAIQVARFCGRPVPEIIAMWTEVAPAFERAVGKARVTRQRSERGLWDGLT